MRETRACHGKSAVAISARRSEQDLSELRGMVGEALAALPEEAKRLERLAAAPAAELPGIVRALQTA